MAEQKSDKIRFKMKISEIMLDNIIIKFIS